MEFDPRITDLLVNILNINDNNRLELRALCDSDQEFENRLYDLFLDVEDKIKRGLLICYNENIDKDLYIKELLKLKNESS